MSELTHLTHQSTPSVNSVKVTTEVMPRLSNFSNATELTFCGKSNVESWVHSTVMYVEQIRLCVRERERERDEGGSTNHFLMRRMKMRTSICGGDGGQDLKECMHVA